MAEGASSIDSYLEGTVNSPHFTDVKMENSSTWEDEREVNDNELQATLENRLCIRTWGGGRSLLK